jgi:hypothetical protein
MGTIRSTAGTLPVNRENVWHLFAVGDASPAAVRVALQPQAHRLGDELDRPRLAPFWRFHLIDSFRNRRTIRGLAVGD